MRSEILAAEKVYEILISAGWEFDNREEALKDINYAFKDNTHRNCLSSIIKRLLDKNWIFYGINDVKLLDEARKIYKKHE